MTIGHGDVHSTPSARKFNFRDESELLCIPGLARPSLPNSVASAFTSECDSNCASYVLDERFRVQKQAPRTAKSVDQVPPNTAKSRTAFWARILGRNMVPRARVPTVGTRARGTILRPGIRAQNADHESGPQYGSAFAAAQRFQCSCLSTGFGLPSCSHERFRHAGIGVQHEPQHPDGELVAHASICSREG